MLPLLEEGKLTRIDRETFFVDLEKIITCVHIWGIARHTSFFDVDLKTASNIAFFQKASCWFCIAKQKASWKGWFKLFLVEDGGAMRTAADCRAFQKTAFKIILSTFQHSLAGLHEAEKTKTLNFHNLETHSFISIKALLNVAFYATEPLACQRMTA